METLKRYLRKLLSLLRVRVVAGGLEISDQVLRLVYFDGKVLQMAAVVLGPGVMEKGAIKDATAFVDALHAVKEKIPAFAGKKKKMNVVVSLGSASIYTQSFNLPIMEGKELTKAIDLNVQMSSPDDLAKSYFSSEILDRDDEHVRLEIAAAFIDKQLVDALTGILFSAGFIVLGVESRALALVRMIREKAVSFDITGSYLVLDIDETGIDFLVMRKGRLYFEYATLWSDIADAKGEVAMEKFSEALSANLRQVTNFYHQRWQDPLVGVIIPSAMLHEEAEKIAGEASTLPVVNILFDTDKEPVSPEWLVAVGASLRGARADINDGGINLGGEGAEAAFFDEQVLNFLDFWQVLVPAVLGVLVIVLVVAYNFLAATGNRLSSSEASGQQGQLSAQIRTLEASSTAFNQEVQLVLVVQASHDKSHMILDEIANLAAKSSVSIDSLTFQGASAPISLSGVASTEDDIVQFKNLVAADPNFGTVNLPLSGIQPSLSAYSFSMTFPLAANAFQ